MTSEERAEWERREAIRAARHAQMVERMREANLRSEALAQRVCEEQLRKVGKPQLEFSI